jgi:hypothetical protein
MNTYHNIMIILLYCYYNFPRLYTKTDSESTPSLKIALVYWSWVGSIYTFFSPSENFKLTRRLLHIGMDLYHAEPKQTSLACPQPLTYNSTQHQR